MGLFYYIFIYTDEIIQLKIENKIRGVIVPDYLFTIIFIWIWVVDFWYGSIDRWYVSKETS